MTTIQPDQKKQVHLDKRAIQAHDKLNRPIKKRLSCNTLTSSLPAVTESDHTEGDDVFDSDGHSSPRARASLYGVALSMRAFQITRRLSVSQYMMTDVASQLTAGLFGQRKDSTLQNNSIKYENTYRIDLPDADGIFPCAQITRIIDTVLETNLNDQTYNGDESPSLVKFLSSSINSRVKMIDMPRYKFICNVIIGQNLGQSTQLATRCLWNDAVDSHACATFKNSNIFAVATVHAVYFE